MKTELLSAIIAALVAGTLLLPVTMPSPARVSGTCEASCISITDHLRAPPPQTHG